MSVTGAEIRKIVEEELRSELGKYYFRRMGFGEFEYNILFYKYGYMPHFAEHVIDPRDGREKLVMADPHIRRSAFVYDLKNGEIEWEVLVPGTAISANPHIARMLPEAVPEINAEAGDIICADRSGRWILIDRDTKEIKWTLTQDDASWPHDILPTKNKDGFILTDYSAGFCRKVKFDGSVVWNRDMGAAAKLSLVEGTTPSGGHTNSFGGDYIATGNANDAGVHEIRDSDGEIVWKIGCSVGSMNVSWPPKPHSAFRWGITEGEGNLTIVGFEAGGGIVAFDKECRPRWGFMKPYSMLPSGIYRPTSYGLMETFHVFPTLWGTIGAIDAGVKYGSQVIEVIKWPRKTTLWFFLAQDHDPGDSGTYYDPPLEVAEWDEIYITFINRGDNPIDYTIYGTRIGTLFEADWPSHWEIIWNEAVAGGAVKNVIVDQKWWALRVFGKRSTPGAGSTVKILVTFVRK